MYRNTVKPGTTLVLTVKYFWGNNNPNRDFTVSVYSMQDIKITEMNDSPFANKKTHMDGNEPSGFQNSKYRGMNWTGDCSLFGVPKP